MIDRAGNFIPEWAEDVWDVFVAPGWPWEHRTVGNTDWGKWTSGGECSGLWETLDRFPPRVALLWEELLITRTPGLCKDPDGASRAKLLADWQKRFTSARIRCELARVPTIGPSSRPEADPSPNSYLLGCGQVATIQRWQKSTCNHPEHPYSDCSYSAREVLSVLPSSTKNYWIACIQEGERNFNVVLETPLRVELGSRGFVEVCHSQQILQWFLPLAARKLDSHSHELPLIIARSQIEGLFFRASRRRNDW